MYGCSDPLLDANPPPLLHPPSLMDDVKCVSVMANGHAEGQEDTEQLAPPSPSAVICGYS